MKKNIKRLSLILAILLLSMTLAIPAAAVEYDIDSRAVDVLGRRNDVYVDPITGDELLNCFAYLAYNDVSKVAYMSADCSLAGYDFREFGVRIDGNISYTGGTATRNPRELVTGLDVHDIAEVNFEIEVESNCISITSWNSFFVDTFSSPVVDWAFSGVEGVDFDY